MPTLYIVTPVASDVWFADKRAIVESACKVAALNAHYPGFSTNEPRFDLDAELAILRLAKLALVDVSFERPSCYFELGLIEAIGCPVKVIAESGTILHQTSHRQDVQFYSGLDAYGALIRAAIESVV